MYSYRIQLVDEQGKPVTNTTHPCLEDSLGMPRKTIAISYPLHQGDVLPIPFEVAAFPGANTEYRRCKIHSIKAETVIKRTGIWLFRTAAYFSEQTLNVVLD